MRTALIGAAVAAILFSTVPAIADTASVDHVSPDGDIIWLDNGNSYDVTSGDVSNWNEGDSVWTDDSTMVDTDQDDQVDVSPR